MTNHNLVADIKGYAAVFNRRDLNGDIIEPGAFAASLRTRSPIRMLYQHNAEAPIGRWTSLTEDKHGLFVTGEIILSSPRAHEVHALLAGGAIDGLSIGYQTVRARKTRAPGRNILQADLWEVSVVTFPMAQTARITHVGEPRADHFTTPAREGAQSLTGSHLRPAREGAQSLTGSRLRSSGRALVPPPTSARHFADALRDAANILSV